MQFMYSEIVQGKLNPVSRLYYVILISTGHGFFFINLQDIVLEIVGSQFGGHLGENMCLAEIVTVLK